MGAAGAAPEALRQPREASRAVERYEELRLRGRRTAEEVVRAAEELIDFKWASTERGRPILLADPAEASAAGPSPGETAGAAARIGDELERLLLRGEEKRRLDRSFKLMRDGQPGVLRGLRPR